MIIDVKKLMLDVEIVKMVRKCGGAVPEEYEENVYDAGTFALSESRLESVKKGEQYPIDVVETRGGRMYYILNGRHRVARCILEGKGTIEVNVSR